MATKIRYYTLDISECQGLDPIFNGVAEIPIMTGQYEYKYDVVEDELDPVFCNKIRYESEVVKLFNSSHEAATLSDNEISNYMPLGFDTAPTGAKLIELN